MRKLIVFFSWLVVIVLSPSVAASGEIRLIHVELTYSGSAASYVLYKDGLQACTSNAPQATQMDCFVEIDDTPMTFTLTAIDEAGIESPQSAPFILVPPAIDPQTGNYIPQADFTISADSGQAPLPVSFDASKSWDLGGMIISYNWDFGDGNVGNAQLVDHTFTSPGTYNVTLTVTDDESASAQKTSTITVASPSSTENQLPIAIIVATTIQAEISQIRFDAAESSDPDGTIASYSWNFGDGTTGLGTQVDHTFMTAGDYTVTLTVTDQQGGSSQDKITITIVDAPKPTNQPPTAYISASNQQRLMHFEWDYSGSDPELAGFKFYQNSRLVCDIADPTARQADCLTYIDNGTVQFAITAYDHAGTESSPSANLTFDNSGIYQKTSGNAPLPVHFTPGASADQDGTITTYAWDFGDGETATSVEADHIFTEPGHYTVTLTVTDNNGEQASTMETIEVTGGNPPTAANASFATFDDKSLTATLNANDPDGSALTFRITKAASLGTVTITDVVKGIFTYVPKLGLSGDDTFAFKTNDGSFDSNEAIVSINIQKSNSAPMAFAQSITVRENNKASGTLQATDPDNDQLTFSLVDVPTHGSVTIVNPETGDFTYTPAANFYGTDSFTFKANDSKLDSGLATITISITPDTEAPTASNSSVSTKEDLAVSGTVSATDPDGDTLTFSIISNGTKGHVVIIDATTGDFTYTPSANTNGQDSFVVRVSDGKMSTDATVTVSIDPINDVPRANPDSVKVKRRGSISIPVLANDSDIDGDSLTVVSIVKPQYGTATITDGSIAYTADKSYLGDVSFTYEVSDGNGGLDKGSVTVTAVR